MGLDHEPMSGRGFVSWQTSFAGNCDGPCRLSIDIIVMSQPRGGAESQNLIAILNRVKSDAALLLVEHDMDVVFSVADEVTVMVDGAVVVTGSPDDIRNQRAQQAYLGESGSEYA